MDSNEKISKLPCCNTDCCQSGCEDCPYNYKDRFDPSIPPELMLETLHSEDSE